jgi:thiol-disulfide isomerase/thioredoxin
VTLGPRTALGRPAGSRRAASFLAALCCALLPACGRERLLSVEQVDLETLAARIGAGTPGQPRLVNFWATWCPPCVAELPELVDVAHDHSGEALVVAVSMDLAIPQNPEIKVPADVEAFARPRGLDLPILVLDGTAEEASARFGLPGAIPFTMALDRNGKVVATQEGQTTRERFEEMLAAAMR